MKMLTETKGASNDVSYEYWSRAYSSPPHVAALPYTHTNSVVTGVCYTGPLVPVAGKGWPVSQLYPPELQTKLYAKFNEELKSNSTTSMLALTLAEYRESYMMMLDRVMQLIRVLQRAKREKWDISLQRAKQNASPGKHPRKPNPRKYAKKAGSWWLEYWLGWSALIGDLFQTYLTLVEERMNDTYPVSARVRQQWTEETGKYAFQQTFPSSATGILRERRVTMSRLRFGANVGISNPNAYLATALGFSNPAGIAVELVSRSFVLNYFITLNEFLSQFDFNFGVEISNGHFTYYNTTDATIWARKSTSSPLKTGTVRYYGVRRQLMDRPPGPSLHVRPFKGLSSTRGATLSALLVQYLKEVPYK